MFPSQMHFQLDSEKYNFWNSPGNTVGFFFPLVGFCCCGGFVVVAFVFCGLVWGGGAGRVGLLFLFCFLVGWFCFHFGLGFFFWFLFVWSFVCFALFIHLFVGFLTLYQII